MSRKVGWFKYDGKYLQYELAVCPGCGRTYYVNGPQDRNHAFCKGHTMSGVPGDAGWLEDGMTKVELTTHDGTKIWVFPTWVQAVRKALPGEGGKTSILMSGPWLSVMETVNEVVEKLEFA